jgi:hypothetical protein
MNATTDQRVHERTRRRHLDVPYEIWEVQQSWWWLVVSPSRNSGAIGAAATADQAAHDACRSIEELCPESPLVRAEIRSSLSRDQCHDKSRDQCHDQCDDRCDPIRYGASSWDACFTRLQHYLDRLDSAAV